MSRRKKVDTFGEEGTSYAGSNRGILTAVIVIVLLVAGLGSAAYYVVENSNSPSGIQYNNGGTSGTSTNGGNETNNGNGGITPASKNPLAVMKVKSADGKIDGTIKIELYKDKAPITVDNFIKYANDSFYNGLIFHRVMKDFVAQGGGFYYDSDGQLKQKPATYPPIKNEANNGLSNIERTIAMARTNDPNSATSQFYFNLVDNTNLDYRDPSNPGYCVFGKVISGWDIVQQIAQVPVTDESGMQNVPTVHIVIESVTIEYP